MKIRSGFVSNSSSSSFVIAVDADKMNLLLVDDGLDITVDFDKIGTACRTVQQLDQWFTEDYGEVPEDGDSLEYDNAKAAIELGRVVVFASAGNYRDPLYGVLGRLSVKDVPGVTVLFVDGE